LKIEARDSYFSQNGEEKDDHRKEQIIEPKPSDPPLQQAFPATRNKKFDMPWNLGFTLKTTTLLPPSPAKRASEGGRNRRCQGVRAVGRGKGRG
jgi:hypothetical protein